MGEQPIDRLKADDVRKTYRYLRIGMIGAVVLLAVSVAIEANKTDCFQTSISAYYYTPVEAIFVGFLIALGLALIVYKGRSAWEDFFLNIAGMLAPVVAVAPTTDVGRCWSVPPINFPVQDGTLANWVVTNIENNISAVLVIGVVAVTVSIINAIADTQSDAELGRRLRQGGSGTRQATEEDKSQRRWRLWETWGPVALSVLLLLVGFGAFWFWDDFNTRAHGVAALILIVCLGLAIIAQANSLWPKKGKGWRRERDRTLFWIYIAIVGFMALGGIFIWLTRVADEHTVFVLETWEIFLFAVYWIVETKGKWDEEVGDTRPVAAGMSGG